MTLRPVVPEEWRPHGIPNLEHNAWTALRQIGSTSVVAGPGAGKSEFLAQRAAYLLETGLCKAPQQILAISFKTDAAANLAARVRKRCPPELAVRFTSLTFDAFTKSLVDRFHAAIPQHWRPTRPYDIGFLTRRMVEHELNRIRSMAQPAWQGRKAENIRKAVRRKAFVGCISEASCTIFESSAIAVPPWRMTPSAYAPYDRNGVGNSRPPPA